MNAPILITGCARSGTSMTAGIIHAGGAFGGKLLGPNQWNAKGMFENVEIREKIVKPFLTLNGADPLGQDPLPDPTRLIKVENWRSKIEMMMKFQGYKYGPWFYKCAKACLFWPTWHEAFPDAKWVVVRRKDEDIIYSCLRTGFMRAYRTPVGWQGWIDVHKTRFQEMHESGMEIREVWPTKFVEGDFTEIKEVIAWLGLKWQEEFALQFVDSSLWRGKNG